ncbi:hypothetical protein LIER_40712 [Lithospermum erythrorhizon]|uniref:FYVE-type domain-containing protein n=1 Tax=Lithospermum erythrorhizon TaxID=34254 RepID=A0AAV3R155_LITER
MHQPDQTTPFYPHYPQQHPTPTYQTPPPPPPNPSAASYASAPPVASSSDYSNYPQFPQIYDHPSNPNPNQSYIPQNPNPNYNFPHLDPNSAPYHQPNHYDQQLQSTPNFNYDYSNLNSAYNYTPSVSAGSYPPVNNSASYNAPVASSYGKLIESSAGYGGYGDQGVYKYSGGKTVADGGYGGGKGLAGAGAESSGSVLFDDYGRPISVGSNNGREQSGGRNSTKIVKAVPKVEEHTDVKSGVQKYRVKLLSEGYGQSDMDVLCQIGLDGIRILEPSTSRMLKIYSIETITRWDVLDSYIFAFWAKTSVDAETRRVRLKSNSYTTNNILDTVTAASIQVKEIGASKPSQPVKVAEQPSEKKKGLTDWVNFIKPGNEEKDHWVPDEAVTKCTGCGGAFNAFNRRHHCRNCGEVFCDKCTQGRIALTADENAQPVRVCDQCMVYSYFLLTIYLKIISAFS